MPRWQPHKKSFRILGQQKKISTNTVKFCMIFKKEYTRSMVTRKNKTILVSLILQLSTRDNVKVFGVWAPQRLGDKILEEHYDFVFNEGFAKSTKTGNFYFKFSLL